MLDHFTSLTFTASWVDAAKAMLPTNWRFKQLRRYAFVAAAIGLIDFADQDLGHFAARVTYMGPLRASAQRYYRVQNLAVREIDYQGENLAMFLRSLSPTERAAFVEFSKRHFGVEIYPRVSKGHVEILLKELTDGASINLADVGFGYSQLLPVLAQVWAIFGRRERRVSGQAPHLVAIEQPELHLHPTHQARLADLFVGAIGTDNPASSASRFIVETHSESVINRLGHLIRTSRLSPDKVQLLIFRSTPEEGRTEVSTASFSDDGALQDWPYGFFSPSID